YFPKDLLTKQNSVVTVKNSSDRDQDNKRYSWILSRGEYTLLSLDISKWREYSIARNYSPDDKAYMDQKADIIQDILKINEEEEIEDFALAHELAHGDENYLLLLPSLFS